MDYAPIQAFLVGRCGKGVRDAALTSFEEYTLLAEGYARREQEEWERMRWSVFMQWAISPNLKNRPKTPQDIVRFAWEKEEALVVKEIEPLTENEIMGLCDLFNINRENISNGQDR
jgi:hypothetical protein